MASLLISVLASLTWSGMAYAQCFDFSKGVAKPLKEPVSYGKRKQISKAGTDATKKFIWGYARGRINKPIKTLYEKLLDHYSIKDPEKVKLNVYDQEKEGFQDFHLVMVSVKKVPIPVSWEEEWAYAITQGTKDQPKKVLIQNQKVGGNRFLRHLCGTIVLESIDEKATDVFIYEELDALGKRSVEDTEKGHMGTLETLRK